MASLVPRPLPRFQCYTQKGGGTRLRDGSITKYRNKGSRDSKIDAISLQLFK